MHSLSVRLPRALVTLCLVFPALVVGRGAFTADPDVKDGVKAVNEQGSKTKGVYRLPIPPKNFSPPAILVDELVHEWGSVVQGTVVKHTFQVKNSGGAPLIIDNVKPQCGCTAVDKPTKPILPGGSDSITLSVDTKRFKGPMKKTAKVHSNASTQPVVLTMQGTVEQVFVTDPESPRIEVVRGSEAPTSKITLRNVSDRRAKVLEVTSQNTVIEDPTLKEIEPGKLYEVDFGIALTDKRSFFYENLLVKFETEGQETELSVRVTIVVKKRIDVSPRSAYFPRQQTDLLKVPNAPPLVKEVTIKSLGGPEHAFEILEVVNPGTSFETRVETVKPGREYKLIVTLGKLPENHGRTVRDRLTIKTDDPNQPELTLTAMGIFATNRRTAATRRLTLPRTKTSTSPKASTTSPASPPKASAAPKATPPKASGTIQLPPKASTTTPGK